MYFYNYNNSKKLEIFIVKRTGETQIDKKHILTFL